MSNDDLILDIVEKIHDKIEKLDNDVTDMRIEQGRQNIIVERHEARSTAAEQRLHLLEKDAQFFRNFIMIMTALGAIITFAVKIFPYLSSH